MISFGRDRHLVVLKGRTPGKNHDNILYYSKSENFTYNTIYLPYSEDYVKQRFSHKEVVNGKERYFKDAFLGTATTQETIEKLKAEGRIYYTNTGAMRLKVYIDDAPGIPLDDVWTDINAVNSQAEELVEYATKSQKLSWSASSRPLATRTCSLLTFLVAVA